MTVYKGSTQASNIYYGSTSFSNLYVGSGVGGSGTPFPLALGSTILFEGDSLTSRTDGCSVAGWLSIITAGKVNYPAMLSGGTGGTVGVGGEGSAEILAQAPGNISSYPGIKVIVIHIGTNDLSTLTAAQILSNIQAACALYNAAGTWVVYSCILPRGDAIGLANETKRTDVNSGMATYAVGKRVSVVNHDANFQLSDPTWQAGDSLPHANVVGTKRLATNLAAAFSFVGTNVTQSLPTNILLNPTLTGTSGQNAGTFNSAVVPTNWRIDNGTGATIDASVVNVSGVNKMQFDISGTCNNAGLNLVFRTQASPWTNIQIGEWIEGKMDVEITGPGGVGGIVGLDGWAVRGGLGYIFDQNHGPSVYGSMSTPIIDPNTVSRILPLKETSINSPNFQFLAQFAVGAVSGRIRVSAPHAGKFGT